MRIIAISGCGNFGPLAHEHGSITTPAYLTAALKAGADEVLIKPSTGTTYWRWCVDCWATELTLKGLAA